MDQNALSSVIATEKKIREALDAERNRAAEWLEREKKATEADSRIEIEDLAASEELATKKARAAAQTEAARILHDARSLARRLDHLDEERLVRTVLAGLQKLVPGAKHDR